jgi:hypothetical protein
MQNVAATIWIASLSRAMTRLVRHLMPLRLRKFIGAIALFVLVIVWALVAMALAQMPAIRESAIISVAYYVVAGIGWCLPAIPIVTWMSRPGVSDQ